jgi:WD repeat/SOCS box-containing protein 1
MVWDMVTYSLARTLTGHHHNVSACEFSPDGAILASSSWDTRVILWDPYTGIISTIILLLDCNWNSFLFKKGEELRELCHQYPPPRPIFASGANGSWVRGVAYARNGGQTATISDDGLIRFWNLLEPEVDPSAIAQGDEEMVCCTFSPSGRVFAVG